MVLAVQSLVSAISDTAIFALAAAIAVFVGLGAGIGMAIATSKALDRSLIVVRLLCRSHKLMAITPRMDSPRNSMAIM